MVLTKTNFGPPAPQEIPDDLPPKLSRVVLVVGRPLVPVKILKDRDQVGERQAGFVVLR